MISIFALGVFVIIASIVRMVMLRSSSHTDDPTWGSMRALIWTEVEANTSVICCCLPALRVPCVSLWHKLRDTYSISSPPVSGDRPNSPNANWTNRTEVTTNQGHTAARLSTHMEDGRPLSAGLTRTSSDTWYDRVLGSIGKEKDEPLRASSEDDLITASDGTVSKRQPGAIYVTTSVHVERDVEQGEKKISLQDILSER